MTQEDFADHSAISFQRISELERGVGNPTFTTLIRVAEGLGVELSEIAILTDKIHNGGRR